MASKKRNTKESEIKDEILVSEETEESSKTGKETRKKKKIKKKGKWYFKLLRIIFLWLPLTIIALIALTLLIAEIYLSPERVENLAVDNFNKLSNGTLELNVKEFSPYSGFIIENIIIKNGKDFDNSIFVNIERLVFDYSFFHIFTGSIRLSEIGIYNPSVYLKQKNGKWNFETLMIAKQEEKKQPEPEPEKKPEPKPEKKPEPEKQPEKKEPSEINLPIYVDLLFKFNLENLYVDVDAESFKSNLSDFSLSTDLYIPPFKKVEPGVEAVKLLEKMQLKVNPSQKLNLSFQSKEASVSPPLIFTWNLIYYDEKTSSDKTKFYSNLKLGTYKTPVRFQNKYLTPLNFLVSYDLFFNPIDDFLKLNSFKITFNKNTWLNLGGTVTNVSTKQNFNISMKESLINLNELYPYYRQITGDRKMKFGGNVSLYPLTFKGNPSNVDIFSKISLSNIVFSMPDFSFYTPALEINNFVNYRPSGVSLSTDIEMNRFKYSLSGDRSKFNGLKFNSDIYAYGEFKKFKINSLNLRFFNPATGRNGLTVAMNGNASLGNSTSGNIRISKLTFNKKPLIAILPGSIGNSLKSIPLEKDVTLSLNTIFSLGQRYISAGLELYAAVPDYDVNDLRLSVSVLQDQKLEYINLKKLRLWSKSFGLNVNAGGRVEMKGGTPMTDSDLFADISLNYPKIRNVYGPWNVKGGVDISAKIKGSMENAFASGKVNVKNLYVYNKEPSMKLAVEDFNLAFPFEYDLAADYKGESRIAIDKSKFISNENFNEKENISLASFKFKHPARDNQIEYLSNLSGTMFFKRNTFEISRLKASIFGGNLLIKDTLFYLADLKTENMEYKLMMDLTNLDVSKLDKETDVKKNSQLSLNTDLTGKGLNFQKSIDMKGYINIYRIGEKLASQLMKGLSENEGRSTMDSFTKFAVDNSMRVKTFYYYIENGNVYTTVTFEKDLLGYILGVKNEKVSFERIPIQEYLRSVQSKENQIEVEGDQNEE